MDVVDGNITVPVKVGEAKFALRSNAVWRSVWLLSVQVIAHRTGVTQANSLAILVDDRVFVLLTTSSLILDLPQVNIVVDHLLGILSIFLSTSFLL